MSRLLSFGDVAQARNLIADLYKVEGWLAEDGCGLQSVGPYQDDAILNVVRPAYRKALQDRQRQLLQDLEALGVDPNSPRAWFDISGREASAKSPARN